MTFTYDVTSDAGKVRLLLSDVDQGTAVFSDEEIAAFLAMSSGSAAGLVKRAAALAIDTNASDQVLASKVISDHQLTTNGAAVANAMRAHATALRAQADIDDADADEGSYFGVVDIVGGPCGPELTGWY